MYNISIDKLDGVLKTKAKEVFINIVFRNTDFVEKFSKSKVPDFLFDFLKDFPKLDPKL